jgi:hypothetical protein
MVPGGLLQVSNQATSLTDRNGDGTFDSSDTTSVASSNLAVWGSATDIPTFSLIGLATLVSALAAAGWLTLRRH